jgi:hypothetical protein
MNAPSADCVPVFRVGEPVFSRTLRLRRSIAILVFSAL